MPLQVRATFSICPYSELNLDFLNKEWSEKTFYELLRSALFNLKLSATAQLTHKTFEKYNFHSLSQQV